MSGNLNIVKFILHKGGNDIDFALACAAEYGKTNIINYLEKLGAKFDTLAYGAACTGGYIELLLRCDDSNIEYYNIGLKGASKGGRLDLAKMFIKNGATDLDGALQCAAYYGHSALIAYLFTIEPIKIDNALNLIKNKRDDIANMLIAYDRSHKICLDAARNIYKSLKPLFDDEVWNFQNEQSNTDLKPIIQKNLYNLYKDIVLLQDTESNKIPYLIKLNYPIKSDLDFSRGFNLHKKRLNKSLQKNKTTNKRYKT
jgi:hypothetical protein